MIETVVTAPPAVIVSVLVTLTAGATGPLPMVQLTLAVPPAPVEPAPLDTVPAVAPPPLATKATACPGTTLPKMSVTRTVMVVEALAARWAGVEPTTTTELGAPATTETTLWLEALKVGSPPAL